MARRCSLFVWSAVCALVFACGSEEASGPSRTDLLAQSRAALEADDWSATLSHARRALTLHGEDAEALYLAARAAVQLNKLKDTFEFLTRAEATHPKGALLAQLSTIRGQALFKRYGELGAEGDRALASAALQQGTQAGELRADAAYLLAVLQDMKGHKNDAQQRKFGKLFLSLEPDSERATKLRAYLTQKGLLP
ncbi:MAG: hypothetical protein DHS20C15_03010 [Planctomycetota bacterium]|nr:MAG: hypothetical protein DHS20C15_03010 [Planctomycetota bacterium]